MTFIRISKKVLGWDRKGGWGGCTRGSPGLVGKSGFDTLRCTVGIPRQSCSWRTWGTGYLALNSIAKEDTSSELLVLLKTSADLGRSRNALGSLGVACVVHCSSKMTSEGQLDLSLTMAWTVPAGYSMPGHGDLGAWLRFAPKGV